jgi:hypothetical protein
MEATGVELIVRSHQLPTNGHGFALHHASKVMTIFSASNLLW